MEQVLCNIVSGAASGEVGLLALSLGFNGGQSEAKINYNGQLFTTKALV